MGRVDNVIAKAREPKLEHRDTDLAPPLRTKFPGSIGLRRRIGGSVLTFAITENFVNFENTLDIGLQIGWTCCAAMAER